MLTEQKIMELLRDRNLRAVSRAADVSYFALHRWMRGHNERPSHRMILKLDAYLRDDFSVFEGNDE